MIKHLFVAASTALVLSSGVALADGSSRDTVAQAPKPTPPTSSTNPGCGTTRTSGVAQRPATLAVTSASKGPWRK